MKNTLTTVRKHGSNRHEEIVGVNAPHRDHRRLMKTLRIARKHPVFAEVITWKPVRRFKLERMYDTPVKIDPPKPESMKPKTKAKPKAARKTTSLMAQRIANP